MSAASVAVPPQPYSAQKPADSVGVGRSPPNSPASRSKSLRPLFDQLATAGTHLDSMLEDMQLSKEETESLLASQRFRSHRQLRTELLSQQLQLAAQDHAQYALQRLLDLSNSPHSAIARLAATQILAYAGLTPPAPDQPSFLKTLAPPPEPPPPPSSPPPQSPPTPSARAAPASVPSQSSNPLRFPLTSILLTFLILLPVLLCGKTPNTQWTWLKVMPDQAFSNMAGRWDNYATSNARETYFGAIDPTTSTLHTSTYVGARRPILLKNLSLGKFQATFSFAGTSGIPGNEISFAFNAAGPEDFSYIEIPHQNWADPVYGWQVSQGQNADQVTSTGTAPPSTVDTDIIWSRITFDGTTLTMKRLVNNSSTPTESDWSGATVNFSSTAFAGGGGRLGFVPTGTGSLDNLTIQSWNGSSWTTEVIDNFTVDSSGYAADTPTYDNNGNLTYDGTQSYTYDAWNRLIKISHAYRALTADGGDGNVHSGQVFETNTYDAAGRRIIKAILGTGPQDCTYHYYLSGNNIIEEQNGSAQTLNQNVWGLEYVDQLVQTSFNSDPADQSTCDTPYWVMQDANYNVLGVCDSSGVLRERYEYSAYGQRQVYYSTGSNDPGCYSPTSLAQLCEFGFQGLMHDQPANLVYARNRFLNTELGRWNQEDPLGYVDGLNAYEGQSDNPTNGLDASGEITVYVHGVEENGSEWTGLRDNIAKAYAPEDGQVAQDAIDLNWSYEGTKNPFYYASDNVGDRRNAADSSVSYGMSAQQWNGADKLRHILDELIELKSKYACLKNEPINIVAYSQGTVITTAVLQAGGVKVDSVVYLGSPLLYKDDDLRKNNTNITFAANHTAGLYNFYSSSDWVTANKGGAGNQGFEAGLTTAGSHIHNVDIDGATHRFNSNNAGWQQGGWLAAMAGNRNRAEAPLRAVYYTDQCPCGPDAKKALEKIEAEARQNNAPSNYDDVSYFAPYGDSSWKLPP